MQHPKCVTRLTCRCIVCGVRHQKSALFACLAVGKRMRLLEPHFDDYVPCTNSQPIGRAPDRLVQEHKVDVICEGCHAPEDLVKICPCLTLEYCPNCATPQNDDLNVVFCKKEAKVCFYCRFQEVSQGSGVWGGCEDGSKIVEPICWGDLVIFFFVWCGKGLCLFSWKFFRPA